MTTDMTTDRVAQLLAPITEALDADGYRLEADVRDGRLRIDVIATAMACEECLIPRDLLGGMVADQLRQGALEVDEALIDVSYPADTA